MYFRILILLILTGVSLLSIKSSVQAQDANTTSVNCNIDSNASMGNTANKKPRAVGYAGKTQMGTQSAFAKTKPTAVRNPCRPSKPVIPKTNHTGTSNPSDTIKVQTTIINNASGNQIIINKVDVPVTRPQDASNNSNSGKQ
jgi:hypothetical protein